MRFFTVIVTLIGIIQSTSAGDFHGRVVVQWLEEDGDDREMQLLEGFSFTDDAGKVWLVPEGARINGASIPRLFWNVIGPPFVGDYRRASVIHDHYCDTKTEPWEKVHEMFYEASIAGGVPEARAKVMYAAIYAGGPRWDQNGEEIAERDSWRTELEEEAMEILLKSAEVSDMSLSKIRQLMDKVRGN